MKEFHISVEKNGLSKAREQVRELISGGFEGEITVHLPEDIYSPEEFVFDSRDCSEKCRVRYLGQPGTVVDGGVTLSKDRWQRPEGRIAELFRPEVRDRIYMADLSALGYSRKSWGGIQAVGGFNTAAKYPNREKGVNCQVFCGDKRMELARYPNGGYAAIDAVMDMGQVSEFPPQNYFSEWANTVEPRGGCYIMDPAMAKRVLTWKTDRDVWMFGYLFWDWADSSTPVRLKAENRLIMPEYASTYGCRSGAKYYFFNVPEELDEPGEWYLDRDEAKLFFYPHGEEEIAFTCGTAPLISCKGTVNMVFEGLTLRNTAGDAVVSDGDGMSFLGLDIQKIGGTGIVARGRNNLVEKCEVSLTGKGGVYLTGGDRTTLSPGNNRVTCCDIHDYAQVHRTYSPGVGLYGVGNRCDGNEIYRAPHMAVHYGGNCHSIDGNYIHHTVTDSQDAGAIYGGRDWTSHGTEICGNLLVHIGSEEFKPAGIYWDDGLSGQTARGNVLIDVGGQGFLVGGGREIIVEENLLINCGVPLHYDDRNRDGFVHGGWAKHAVMTKDGFMWRSLDEVPYTSGVWAEKYPLLARLITDFSVPDHVDFPTNPSYSGVRNNTVVGGGDNSVAASVYTYSEVGENPVYGDIASAELAGALAPFKGVLALGGGMQSLVNKTQEEK